MSKPNFSSLRKTARGYAGTPGKVVGHPVTIALTPVADGRAGAYEDNQEKTWAMVERVYDLLSNNVFMPDGTPVRIVVPPEIVYGARSAAIAQAHYVQEGVSANIFLSRCWAYSDELMGVCMGVGSSEWVQAAWGLNQTDRPGAVWLKAFCAAMDEKKRPIFSIYNPDLESEDGDIAPFVAERLMRFARCAAAVGTIRGKNYLGVGGVSMGIIGSDARRNVMHHYFGMGTVSVDMSVVSGRIDRGFYDHEEFDRAFAWYKKNFKIDYANQGGGVPPRSNDELLAYSVKMALIVRDLMVGNPRLADEKVAKKQGFKADVEYSQGHNAIASGTQGQRQWTDLFPNFDLAESILTTSFDWDGFRVPYIVATENDSKNAIGMLVAHLLSGGAAQLFADIRTNWTANSIKALTGKDVSKIVPGGMIDKRNSGAGSLDYAIDLMSLVDGSRKKTIQKVMADLRASAKLQKDFVKSASKGTTYMAAILQYFPGDGLSSHYRTPGGVPMTAYRYNCVGDMLTCSVVEGETVELPKDVADHISKVTNPTWPESYWVPRGMTSFEYMSKMGPNHDANSFGLIGADMLTFNAMLRIPVDLHNIPADEIFRPTMWDRFGGDDFRACAALGPLYV